MANSDAKTTATTDALDPRAFRQALGQFPTGVAVVTATHDNYPIGMTANSFSSVSLAPPLVSWSVAKSSPNHDPFVAAEAFAVHFLGADHHELALRFGQRGADKFAGLAHAPGDTGAPLIEGLAPIFECRAWARYPGGVIHGLLTKRTQGEALEFAVAASALKHTINGDFNLVSVAEVEALVGGDASGRVQR